MLTSRSMRAIEQPRRMRESVCLGGALSNFDGRQLSHDLPEVELSPTLFRVGARGLLCPFDPGSQSCRSLIPVSATGKCPVLILETAKIADGIQKLLVSRSCAESLSLIRKVLDCRNCPGVKFVEKLVYRVISTGRGLLALHIVSLARLQHPFDLREVNLVKPFLQESLPEGFARIERVRLDKSRFAPLKPLQDRTVSFSWLL